MSRVNGIAIEDYKNLDVLETGLSVPREPLYKYQVSNGYRPGDFIVDQNLVLYLPLYLLVGGKFNSVDRYQHSSTAIGATWGVQGRVFDGSDDYIDCGDNTALDITSAITIEAWVKSSATIPTATRQMILCRDNDSTVRNYSLFFETDGVITGVVYIGDAGKGSSGPSAYTKNSWHHVATTYRSGEQITYLDLVAGTPQGWTGAIDNDDVSLTIGTTDIQARDYAGTIGEIRLYSRALSLAELTQNNYATRWRYQ